MNVRHVAFIASCRADPCNYDDWAPAFSLKLGPLFAGVAAAGGPPRHYIRASTERTRTSQKFQECARIREFHHAKVSLL